MLYFFLPPPLGALTMTKSKPSVNAVTLSPSTVEWLLYIVGRHETDALREMVLPINEPAGKIVFAQYQKGRLTLRFLTGMGPVVRQCPSRHHAAAVQTLIQERGWFFRWEGAAIGLTRLAFAEVASLAHYRCHDDRKSTIHVSGLVSAALIQFANTHLYPTPPTAEGTSHASTQP